MSDIVCYCFSVRKDRIVSVIENGARTVEEVRNILGVTGNCAGCQPDIEALLDFYGRFPSKRE
jgi:NAD(P)H-nitrite reductase large subunit